MTRPRIICHMVSSIDGRLHVGRWTPLAEGQEEGAAYRIYERVAQEFNADAWVVGRVTMQAYATGAAVGELEKPTPGIKLGETFQAQRRGRKLAIAVDPRGKLDFGASGSASEHFAVITGKHVGDAYLATLRRDQVSYLFAGDDGRDLDMAMATLSAEFGVRTLLLEGGGILNGAFLKAGLIDEISLLVYPGIDGLSGEPSIFEYLGQAVERPGAGKQLRFIGAQVLEQGFVWLRYAVEDYLAGRALAQGAGRL